MSTTNPAKPQWTHKYHWILDDSIVEPVSSQPHFCAPQWTPFDKIHNIIKTGGFDSLGHLLKIIFYCPAHKNPGPDPQSAAHISWVASLLQGSSNVLMGDIIVYSHHESQPNKDSVYGYEVNLAFSQQWVMVRSRTPMILRESTCGIIRVLHRYTMGFPTSHLYLPKLLSMVGNTHYNLSLAQYCMKPAVSLVPVVSLY